LTIGAQGRIIVPWGRNASVWEFATMSRSAETELSGHDAELLGRQLFTSLMNLGGYGIEHPITDRAINETFARLEEAAKAHEGVTLLLDRDRLYLDKHPIGSRFNPQRLVKLMGDLNLESILFRPNITRDQLTAFLNILAHPKDWPTLDAVRTELSRRQVDGLKLNYVFYRKITDDEEIVSSDQAEDFSAEGVAQQDLSPLLADLMSRIHENPAEAARLVSLAAELGDANAGEDEQLVQSLTRYIGRLSRKLAAQDNAGCAPPEPARLKEQLQHFQQELIESMSLRTVNARLARTVEERLNKANLRDEKPAPDHAIPERVMSASSMAFFLNREVKCALRYDTPFACAMITVDRIVGSDGQSRKPHRSELDQLLPELYRLLFRLLRDLDLIGSLDREHQAVPLILMPMTPHGNANIVRLRLEEALANARFELQGQTIQLLPTVTTMGFRAATHKDLRGYMTHLRNSHARARTA
jgi:hypothetical protein